MEYPSITIHTCLGHFLSWFQKVALSPWERWSTCSTRSLQQSWLWLTGLLSRKNSFHTNVRQPEDQANKAIPKLKDFINKHKKHYYNWLNGSKGLLGFLRSHMQKPSCFAVALQYSCEHHKDEEPETAQRQQKNNKIFPIFWAQSGITEVYKAPDWSQMDAAASPSWSHSLIPAVYIHIYMYVYIYSHCLPCIPVPLQVNDSSCKISWKLHRKKKKMKRWSSGLN